MAQDSGLSTASKAEHGQTSMSLEGPGRSAGCCSAVPGLEVALAEGVGLEELRAARLNDLLAQLVDWRSTECAACNPAIALP